MSHSIQNQTIGFSLEADEFQNDLYSWIQVVEAKDEIFPNVLQRPKTIQWLTIFGVWFTLSIGTYFRFILYEYLFQQYKKKKLTRVNKLSLIVCLLDHLNRTSGALITTLIILTGDSLNHSVGGHLFCIFHWYYTYFAFFYSFVGSLGVSIYRILLIKHNYFLKEVMSEKVMFRLILYGGILLTAVLRYSIYTDYSKLFIDTCMFVPKLQVLQSLDEYEQSRGNLSTMSYLIKIEIGIGAVMALMTISEIIIYIVFFHHMYKHDNSDRLRRLLERNVIKGRNRRNAITFFGQFCSFMFEFTEVLLFVLAYTIGTKTNNLPLIAIVFRRSSFVIMPMVEVMTSDVLRGRRFKFELYNLIFGLN
jgi:hypothetical protein